jgi:acetyltransferase-like isoleucine patch superfamily enzyme
MDEAVYVIGTGGHAISLGDRLTRIYKRVIYVSELGNPVPRIPHDQMIVETEFLTSNPEGKLVVNGVGLVNNSNNIRIGLSLRYRSNNFIVSGYLDSSARIFPNASVSDSSQILENATISNRVQIEEDVIVGIGAVIEHDSIIGKGAFIGPGATICGTAKIGPGALIGAGAVVLPGSIVLRDALVSAGSVFGKNHNERIV